MYLDLDNLKTIRFALTVHKEHISPHVDVNVEGLIEDIDREIESFGPDKFTRYTDYNGPFIEFDEDMKALSAGEWTAEIKYSPEWLKYNNMPENDTIFASISCPYEKGDDYAFVKECMDKAHSFGENLTDAQIESQESK